MGEARSRPPAEYWSGLTGDWTGDQLEALKGQSDASLLEFRAQQLPPPIGGARELLDRFARDGWVDKAKRWQCPSCDEELDAAEADGENCPECGEAFSEHGGVTQEIFYERHLQAGRPVDWVAAIHGMNTNGAWQQEFSWLIGRSWGKSVPVASYKYGIIRLGVLIPWRRRQLQDQLRRRLVRRSRQARDSGYPGRLDVVAHSFGTWLLGHLLREELKRDPGDQLRFGRLILTGCILRPDFDWEILKKAGLVQDVLNHYGSKDIVVPFAHLTIGDSGPSGRRGFDGEEVINVRAEGYGHSDLFSVEKCVVDGKLGRCPAGDTGNSALLHSYTNTWRPFLTEPEADLLQLRSHPDDKRAWKPLPWFLRGTVFPVLALPFAFALLARVAAWLGTWLDGGIPLMAQVMIWSGLGLLALGLSGAAVWAWRRLR